jgi:hypothetical protein
LRTFAHTGAALYAQGIFNKGLSSGNLNSFDWAGADTAITILAMGGYGANDTFSAIVADTIYNHAYY